MNNLIKDIKLIINNTKLLICLLGTIIAICVLVGAYRLNIGEDKKGMTIGVVNNDNSPYSELLLNFFKSNESFLELANIIVDNENVIESEFQNGNIDAYIVIPARFSDSLMNLENTRIKIRINQEKEVEAAVLKAVLTSYEKYVTSVQNNAVGLYSSLRRSGLTKKENMKINLVSSWAMVNMAMGKENYFDYKVINVRKISLIEHYIYIFVFIIIIYYGIYVGVQIKKEQAKGVLKLYRVSKGNVLSFVMSKILVNSVFLLIVISIPIYIISYKIGQGYNMEIMLYTLINVVMYMAMAIMMSFLISNKNAYVLVTNGIAIILLIVGGGIIPENYMPANMAQIVKYMPTSLFEKDFNNVVLKVGNVKYVPLILLSVVCVIMAAIALGKGREDERN